MTCVVDLNERDGDQKIYGLGPSEHKKFLIEDARGMVAITITQKGQSVWKGYVPLNTTNPISIIYVDHTFTDDDISLVLDEVVIPSDMPRWSGMPLIIIGIVTCMLFIYLYKKRKSVTLF